MAKNGFIDDKALKMLMADDIFDPATIRASYDFEKMLYKLQVELFKLQSWVIENNQRVCILFEGRDASGKGGTIKKITRYMNPRFYRVLALPKPSNMELGQWYFQRYISRLPNTGEIVIFDRSWYNRAMVEPVMDFCSTEQYKQFMMQVPEFEEMITNDGIYLIKLWYELPMEIQSQKLLEMKKDPLRRWKVSPIDEASLELYDSYSEYRDKMFKSTNTKYAPWVWVDASNVELARLEAIKHILRKVPYADKDESLIKADKKIIKEVSKK